MLPMLNVMLEIKADLSSHNISFVTEKQLL